MWKNGDSIVRGASVVIAIALTACGRDAPVTAPADVGGEVAAAVTPVAFDCTTVSQIPQIECEALVAIYNDTDGPNWDFQQGWLQNSNICFWIGVNCVGGSVERLQFHGLGLVGAIPPEIADLTALTELALSSNQVDGLPTELVTMSSLEVLKVDRNALTGPIPSFLANLSGLTELNLSRNQLTGSIPASFGGLSGLQELWLFSNQLAGGIPVELGQLTSLRQLLIGDNPLGGTIPPELGNLSQLEDLDIGSSQLTGSIPPEMGQLTQLRNLTLDRNSLTGPIPPELGNLSNMNLLWLDQNQLSGPIPPELGSAVAGSLILNNNQLTGPIPPELGNMGSGSILSLGGNQLTGSIPPELANANFSGLFLGPNRLVGPIPPELGGMTNLIQISLGNNQLTGFLPPELGNLTGVTIPGRGGGLFNFHNNELIGQVPLEVAKTGSEAIQRCDLTGNLDLFMPDLPAYRALTDVNGLICGLPLLNVAVSLPAQIQALVSADVLNAGQGGALQQKVDHAQSHAAAGRTRPALNVLGALTNQVDDLVATGVLTVAQGQTLTDLAAAWRASIIGT